MSFGKCQVWSRDKSLRLAVNGADGAAGGDAVTVDCVGAKTGQGLRDLGVVGVIANGGVVTELQVVEDEVLVDGSRVVGIEVSEGCQLHTWAKGFECAVDRSVGGVVAKFYPAGVSAGQCVEIDFHIDDATPHFRSHVDHVLTAGISDHDSVVAAEASAGGHDADGNQLARAEGCVGRRLEVHAGKSFAVVDIEAHGKRPAAELLVAVAKRAVARVGAASGRGSRPHAEGFCAIDHAPACAVAAAGRDQQDATPRAAGGRVEIVSPESAAAVVIGRSVGKAAIAFGIVAGRFARVESKVVAAAIFDPVARGSAISVDRAIDGCRV